MSDKVLKEFRRGIIELYSNASDHSGTRHGIFVCGQRFPQKAELIFIVADLGIGVAERIKKNLGKDLPPEEALRWAFQTGNTTRKGAGGQGLKTLKEAIGLNGGNIQFVSYEGYLSIKGTDESFGLLEHPFPGTAVCIKFKTNEKNKYYFKDELNGSDTNEN
jgi:signal transduction histidine kinase